MSVCERSLEWNNCAKWLHESGKMMQWQQLCLFIVILNLLRKCLLKYIRMCVYESSVKANRKGNDGHPWWCSGRGPPANAGYVGLNPGPAPAHRN